MLQTLPELYVKHPVTPCDLGKLQGGSSTELRRYTAPARTGLPDGWRDAQAAETPGAPALTLPGQVHRLSCCLRTVHLYHWQVS